MTKVLVIDDEAQIRRFLRAGFELHGFSVLEAENAAVGLRTATMSSPDLIILDLNLPDLEGSEVLERIRSWSNVPVIVLSIQSDEREKVRLLKLGADDYVVKPFGISELLARGEAALRRHLRSTNKDPVVRAGPLVSRSGVAGGDIKWTARAIDAEGICPSSWACHACGSRGHASAIDTRNMGQSRRQHSVSSYPGAQIATKDRGRCDAPNLDRQRVGRRLSARSGQCGRRARSARRFVGYLLRVTEMIRRSLSGPRSKVRSGAR